MSSCFICVVHAIVEAIQRRYAWSRDRLESSKAGNPFKTNMCEVESVDTRSHSRILEKMQSHGRSESYFISGNEGGKRMSLRRFLVLTRVF